MKITIERPNTPTTQLNVVLMANDLTAFGIVKPVMFILPGGPGFSHRSYLNYACLQDVVDLVFHDPRGCGDSDKGDSSSYTMANYIADVDAIRTQLGLEKIIVLGKSYGSMCALGYAIAYPQRTQQLVLAAGAPSYRFLIKAKAKVREIGTPAQIDITEKLLAGHLKDSSDSLTFFKETQTLYSIKARESSAPANVEEKLKQFSLPVLNEGFRHEFWHFDYERALKNIACKTLVLAGQEDWINDPSYAIQMAEGIPNSQLMIFERAGHAMEADIGAPYFQTIADFILAS